MEAVAASPVASPPSAEVAAVAHELDVGPVSLVDELRQNCDATARHALASAIPVPAAVVALAERAPSGSRARHG